jgi:hypothetical protein
MKYFGTNEEFGGLKAFLTPVSTGAKSPEEILETLGKYGIERYLKEEGTLMVRYWQVGAEGFVSPEKAAVIRSETSSPGQGNELDWLSKNLQRVRKEYGGQWVAVYDDRIVAADRNLSCLMNQIGEFDKPLITFIPSEPTVWTFAYVNEEF